MLSIQSRDASEVAAKREAAKHGCCCKCCTITVEIWVCFFIDITSILGLLYETPIWYVAPADLHAVDEFGGYLIFSIFSACLILFALCQGKHAAWPRRMLVRFMSLKLPVFLVFCMGYFTVSPWAAPLAHWVCEHDFEKMRTALGGDYQKCVQWFPWLTAANNLPYVFAYAYTLKASHEWFRCHPGNDDKGIWCSRPASAAREGDEYTGLP